jgi:hypothetical protein
LTLYVINHLGDGVPPQAPLYAFFHQWREQMCHQLVLMLWNPRLTQMASLKERLGSMALTDGPGALTQRTLPRANPLLDRLFQQQQQQRALLAAQAFKVQFEARMAREFTQALQTLAKDGPEVVALKLKDPQPLTRWAAAMVAGRKRLHLEAELIDRLSDPSPQVREAAREALIRLSRGNDFGPLPGATAQQITQAVQAWRHWLSLQEPPERVPEYLDRPQLAEAEQTPEVIREPLPRPQLAQAEDAQP